jgi:hypothetical protein
MTPAEASPAQCLCPKCSAPRRDGDVSCPSCGVIFAKVRPRMSTPSPEPEESALVLTPVAGELTASNVTLARWVFLAFLAFYSFRILTHSIASNYVGESFLHLVNLPFHEAGHVLFSPFGRFLQVAGGTLMQILVPVAVAISFVIRKDHFGAATGLWWAGESMADVAPYADDARAGQLPLLGGVTGSEVADYHDWEVMLSKLGVLTWDHAIGRFFFVVGGITMTAALIFGAASTFKTAKAPPARDS